LSGQEGANSSHPHPHHPSSGGGAKAGAGAAAAGQLLTPTLTGVVASAEAAGSLPPAMLQGSALVTLETGKDYGNLFHRRRLEPPFKPFAAPGADALPHLHHRFKDGVMEVVMVHTPPKPPAARVPLAPSRSTIEGAFASPKEDVNVGNSHPAPADGDPTAATAVPSREFVEGAFLEEGEDEEGGVAVTSANLFPVPSFPEYHSDYFELCRIVHSPFVKSFAYRRLELLEARFQLHKQLNSDRELMESKAVPHRDFYNVRKVRAPLPRLSCHRNHPIVAHIPALLLRHPRPFAPPLLPSPAPFPLQVDTHVHHSACMNQKHLLNFIKMKLKTCPDEVVIERDGKALTLKQVFESLSLTAYDLSVDTLDVHAHDTFHRCVPGGVRARICGCERGQAEVTYVCGLEPAEGTSQISLAPAPSPHRLSCH
jgi:hypothetical protein